MIWLVSLSLSLAVWWWAASQHMPMGTAAATALAAKFSFVVSRIRQIIEKRRKKNKHHKITQTRHTPPCGWLSFISIEITCIIFCALLCMGSHTLIPRCGDIGLRVCVPVTRWFNTFARCDFFVRIFDHFTYAKRIIISPFITRLVGRWNFDTVNTDAEPLLFFLLLFFSLIDRKLHWMICYHYCRCVWNKTNREKMDFNA